MELAAKYALTVYEKRSFSKAARALFISQPALSLMVAKLESELGFKIFDRSRSMITPTVRGQIYFDALTEIRESEMNMKKRIEQLSAPTKGRISLGCTLYLAECILPEACRRFSKLFPKIPMRLNMGNKGSKDVLKEYLEAKMVDFIFSFSYNEKTSEAIPIAQTRMMIAIRRDHPDIEPLIPYALSREQVLRKQYDVELDKEMLEPLKNVGFITTDTFTGYRTRLDELIDGQYSLANVSIHNIRNLGMNYQMMRAGLGATLAHDINVSMPVFDDDDIIYFALKTQKSFRTLYAVYRKGEELSEYDTAFINVFTETLNEYMNRSAEQQGE